MNSSHKFVPSFPIVIQVMAIVMACIIIPAGAVTVTDDDGTVISLNATPTRIVSLAPSNTEILAALGLRDHLTGVTDLCNYPPEVSSIPRVGGYSSISIEKVVASRPDLVVASDITPREVINRLRQLGIPVVVVAPRNIGSMITDIRRLGILTGTGPQAHQLAAGLSGRIDAATPMVLPSDSLTVAHVIWHDPIYVSGNDTLQDDVIVTAGGTNIFSDKNGWNTVSLEEFLLRNPDIIIVNGGNGMDADGNSVILEAFMDNPQYASLAAVKEQHVYSMNADITSRAGPRIVEATEQVATIIRMVNEERNVLPRAGRMPASVKKIPGFPIFAAINGVVILALIRRISVVMNGPGKS
jgi:iron complex transport system substrate-binding protein